MRENKGTTLIEFAIVGTYLTFLFLMIIGFFIRQSTVEDFELYTTQVARDIVTCKDLEDANRVAAEELNLYFEKNNQFDKENIVISVDYVAGSRQEWKKGSYISLYVEIKLKPVTILKSMKYSNSKMVMVEYTGEYDDYAN